MTRRTRLSLAAATTLAALFVAAPRAAKGGYRSFDEQISLASGQKMDLKVRLEMGDSPAPGRRPGA